MHRTPVRVSCFSTYPGHFAVWIIPIVLHIKHYTQTHSNQHAQFKCVHTYNQHNNKHMPRPVVTVIVYTFLSRNLLFCILFYRLLHVNAWLNDRWILVQEEEEEEENGNDELSISMIQPVSVSVSWRVISSQYTFCQQMISNFFENTEKTILYTSTLNARDTITWNVFSFALSLTYFHMA